MSEGTIDKPSISSIWLLINPEVYDSFMKDMVMHPSKASNIIAIYVALIKIAASENIEMLL